MADGLSAWDYPSALSVVSAAAVGPSSGYTSLDTVDIVSPGLFPEGDAPEEHLSGKSGPSRLRNPLIAQTLFRAGMIERYGSGIPRIKSACDEAGVPFEYSQRGGRTAVSFERVGASSGGRRSGVVEVEIEALRCFWWVAHPDAYAA